MKTQADVLVIDDSDIARMAMVDSLRDTGLRVVDLPSPIGASRTILRMGVRVVIIDVNMPSMRGDKLAALFRRNARLGSVKVILVSGQSSESLLILAKEAGADAVVSKEHGYRDLAATVLRCARNYE